MGVGPCDEIVRRYVKSELLEPSRSVLVVPACMGGTQISRWAPGADLFERMLVGVTAALEFRGPAGAVNASAVATPPGYNRVVGLFWHQGESDRLREVKAYARQLREMVGAFRLRVAAATAGVGRQGSRVAGALLSIPFVAGQLELSNVPESGAQGSSLALARLWLPWTSPHTPAAAVLSDTLPTAALVSATGLHSIGRRNLNRYDMSHFDAVSARRLGWRYWSAYLCVRSYVCVGRTDAPPPVHHYRWACSNGLPLLMMPTVSRGSWYGPSIGGAWRVQLVRAAAAPPLPLPPATSTTWLATLDPADYVWPPPLGGEWTPTFTFTGSVANRTLVMPGHLRDAGRVAGAQLVHGLPAGNGSLDAGTATLVADGPSDGGENGGRTLLLALESEDLEYVALPLWALCAGRRAVVVLCAGAPHTLDNGRGWATGKWALHVSAVAFAPVAQGAYAELEFKEVASAPRVVPLPADALPPLGRGCAMLPGASALPSASGAPSL
jgi:hypothetical protein